MNLWCISVKGFQVRIRMRFTSLVVVLEAAT